MIATDKVDKHARQNRKRNDGQEFTAGDGSKRIGRNQPRDLRIDDFQN